MPKNQNPKVIAIIGPTASGKSDLGIKLAKKFNGEIISADSRQVYKKMDIGTGKVSKKEQRSVKHYLLDVANPKKTFTVVDFKKLSQKAISDIVSQNRLPFVVGGTGFYIDALVKNLSFPEVLPDKILRLNLNRLTAEQLFHKLKNLDYQRAKTIDPKNKRRLIRALEIITATGKPVPKLVSSIKYQVLWLGLRPKNLENKIKLRLEARLKQGMVKEVKNLHKQRVSWKRLDDLGLEYRWISRFLVKNAKSKMKNYNLKFKNSEEYKNLLKEIIKYSKRQMTWFTRPNFVERNLGGFKRNKNIHWIKNQKEAEQLILDFVRSPQEA